MNLSGSEQPRAARQSTGAVGGEPHGNETDPGCPPGPSDGAGGDPPLRAELEAAFGASHQRCLRAAARVVRDLSLAEEVVQEAFLAAWRHAPTRYDPARGALEGWLVTLTRHKAIDAVRHAEHLRRVQHAERAATLPASAEPAAEDVAVRRAEVSRLRGAIAELSEAQQRVLVMAYWGGLPQSQIAALDDTPLGTVKTRTAAGFSRLRELLSDD